MKSKKVAAWRGLLVVVLSIYLPRWHMFRLRRRAERLAASYSE